MGQTCIKRLTSLLSAHCLKGKVKLGCLSESRRFHNFSVIKAMCVKNRIYTFVLGRVSAEHEA